MKRSLLALIALATASACMSMESVRRQANRLTNNYGMMSGLGSAIAESTNRERCLALIDEYLKIAQRHDVGLDMLRDLHAEPRVFAAQVNGWLRIVENDTENARDRTNKLGYAWGDHGREEEINNTESFFDHYRVARGPSDICPNLP